MVDLPAARLPLVKGYASEVTFDVVKLDFSGEIFRCRGFALGAGEDEVSRRLGGIVVAAVRRVVDLRGVKAVGKFVDPVIFATEDVERLQWLMTCFLEGGEDWVYLGVIGEEIRNGLTAPVITSLYVRFQYLG